MKDLIIASVNESSNLEIVRCKLTNILEKERKQSSKIGFVAGIITSDGPEYINRNNEILRLYTSLIRLSCETKAFCSSDVFGHGLYEKLDEMKLPSNERKIKIMEFWKQILGSGHITDIYMTPRWVLSKGANEEHIIAKEQGLSIHYLNPLIFEI